MSNEEKSKQNTASETQVSVVPQDQISALMQTVSALVELQKISAAREARLNKVEEDTENRKAARRSRDAASYDGRFDQYLFAKRDRVGSLGC